MLNTRFSDTNYKINTTENTIEQIKAKLKLIHNEIITPKDFIFSIDWLEKISYMQVIKITIVVQQVLLRKVNFRFRVVDSSVIDETNDID